MNNGCSVIRSNYRRLMQAFINVQEFQQRIWVVSIQQGSTEQSSLLNDTYLVNEDSFACPMQWMHKKGYSAQMIEKIDNMRRSQVVKLQVDNEQHSLMRVK